MCYFGDFYASHGGSLPAKVMWTKSDMITLCHTCSTNILNEGVLHCIWSCALSADCTVCSLSELLDNIFFFTIQM